MVTGRPWWMDDPQIIALTERALADIENAPERPATDDPDPVLAEFYSGAASRELAAVRDELGTTRQQVHRRFRDLI